MAYPIRHTDGDAAAGVLRSLFLVVNHQVAYARFGYDARTRSLIAIGSGELQKQIAKVIEVLDDLMGFLGVRAVQPEVVDGAPKTVS